MCRSDEAVKSFSNVASQCSRNSKKIVFNTFDSLERRFQLLEQQFCTSDYGRHKWDFQIWFEIKFRVAQSEVRWWINGVSYPPSPTIFGSIYVMSTDTVVHSLSFKLSYTDGAQVNMLIWVRYSIFPIFRYMWLFSKNDYIKYIREKNIFFLYLIL
jgi:hypothetical protein